MAGPDTAERTCPSCGQASPPTAKFCAECGVQLVQPCPQCGHACEPTHKFCPECGQQLAAAATPVAVPQPPTAALPTPPIPDEAVEPMRAALAGLEGELRHVTVLMADVCGYTAMSEDMHADALTELMDEWLRRCTEAVYKYEGYIDNFMGDAILALFGAPIACEQAPERAIRAAWEIREASRGIQAPDGQALEVSAGVHSGLVRTGRVGGDLRMQYTAMGNTVNLTQRLEAAAEAGQILVSAATYAQVKHALDLRRLEPIVAKNVQAPVQVYEVIALSPSPERAEEAAELTRTPFVDRTGELARLAEGYRAAAAGSAQAVTITGAAGMGKTRLLEEFRDLLAGEAALFLRGTCVSYGKRMAYFPFVELMRSYCGLHEGADDEAVRAAVAAQLQAHGGDLRQRAGFFCALLGVQSDQVPEDMEPDELKLRIFRSMEFLLLAESRRQPVVIIMDGLQWADPLSLELLQYLLDGAADSRILFVLMSREETPLEQRGCAWQELALEPLTEDDHQRLLRAAVGTERLPPELDEHVYHRSQGNPLFAEELLHSLEERGALVRQDGECVLDKASMAGVPEGLMDIIQARIDGLAPPVKQVLLAASVLGERFSRPVLEAVCPVPEGLDEQLKALETLDLVAPGGEDEGEYVFAHPLTREVTYNSLLRQARRRFHHAAGLAIEGLAEGESEQYIEILAHHFSQTDDTSKAVHYLHRAAARAQRTYSNEAAIAHCQEALERIGPEPEDDELRRRRLELLGILGQVAEHVGSGQEALEAYTQQLAAARETGNDVTAAEAHLGLASVHDLQGRNEDAEQHYQAARELGSEAGQDALVARALHGLASLEAERGNFRQAIEGYGQALEVHRAGGDEAGAAATLNSLGVVHLRHRAFDESLECYRQSLAAYERIGHQQGVAQCYNNMSEAEWLRGDFAATEEHQERALAIMQEIGDRPGAARVYNCLGGTHLATGRYREAAEHFAECVEMAEAIGDSDLAAAAYNNRAFALAILGELRQALGHIQRALEIAGGIEHRERKLDALGTHALILSNIGDHEAARRAAQELAASGKELGLAGYEIEAQGYLGRVELRAGRFERALRHGQEMLAAARSAEQRMDQAWALRLCGHALLELGQHEEARRHCEEALEVCRDISFGYEEAQVQLVLGQLAQAEGRGEEARTRLEAALRLARELAIPDLAARAQVLFGELLVEMGETGEARGHLEAAARRLDELCEQFEGTPYADILRGSEQRQQLQRQLALVKRQ